MREIETSSDLWHSTFAIALCHSVCWCGLARETIQANDEMMALVENYERQVDGEIVIVPHMHLAITDEVTKD